MCLWAKHINIHLSACQQGEKAKYFSEDFLSHLSLEFQQDYYSKKLSFLGIKVSKTVVYAFCSEKSCLLPSLPQTLEAVTILLSWLWPALWQTNADPPGNSELGFSKVSSAQSISWTKDMENWVRIAIFGHVYPEKQRWPAWQKKSKARPEGDADTAPKAAEGGHGGRGPQ